MKGFFRWQRVLILLLCFTVVAPIIFISMGRKEFISDLSVIKQSSGAGKLSAIEQEAGAGLKGPKPIVYDEKDLGSAVRIENNVDANHDLKQPEHAGNIATNVSESNGTNHDRADRKQLMEPEPASSNLSEKGLSNTTTSQHDLNVLHPPMQKVADQKVKLVKDNIISAKAFMTFAPPNINPHIVKELRQRVKELEKAVGEVTKDSDLSRSALQRMRALEVSLSKAGRVFPDCTVMATRLRAMTLNAEDQVRAQKDEAAYLLELAARTTPKGLHCLAMRLTAEYFALSPEDRQLPNQQKVLDPYLYHYAVFSDNVLACAVVINSTVSSAMDAEKIVFHVVTDSLNVPAISMWFLLNPPGKVTIQIQSIDDFGWCSTKYNTTLKKNNSLDPRYNSALNHLRFYLPDVFPLLNKILLLDHDVVVQRDLTGLWNLDMNGKVNGAVHTCQEGEDSFRRMDMLMNFSDPFVAKRFDPKACTWAFGMNLFDLREWRRRNLTSLYHTYLQLSYKRPLWRAGSLPLGWATFYNHTVALDGSWQTLGLGFLLAIRKDDIEQAAVLHYDGVRKPWLDIGVRKYKRFWSQHIDYDHRYLQECNIHEE